MNSIASISVLLGFLCMYELTSGAEVKKLQIGVKKKVKDCKRRSRDGDELKLHYNGKLHSTGKEFDSSMHKGEPLSFRLGIGQVVKGWDQGLLNMCEGEKRKLLIPPHLGYGDKGYPPRIPGGATLVFEIELVKIVNIKPFL